MWKNIILGMSLLNILLLYIIWYYSYHIISYCIIYHAYYIIYYIITESYYLILYQSFYIVSFILYKLYRGEKADTIIKKQLQTRNAYIDIELNIAAAALPQINPCILWLPPWEYTLAYPVSSPTREFLDCFSCLVFFFLVLGSLIDSIVSAIVSK